MSTPPQEGPPIDVSRATYKAAQTTVWLHTLLQDPSQSLQKKQDAVDQSILYVARLFRLSGRVMVLPDWLEPLWGLWMAGRGATPKTKVKEEDLIKLAANDLNITLDPVPIAPPGEPASLRLSPELFLLMTEYPIDVLRLSAEPAPVSVDVPMGEPEQSGDEGGDGTSRNRNSHASRGRGGGRGGKKGAVETGRKTSEPTSSAPDTRRTANRSKLRALLDDPGFLYHTIGAGKPGACDRCHTKRVPCHVPRPGATIKGEDVNWNCCGQCHIGKTRCSLVAVVPKVAPKAASIARSQSHGSSQRPVDEPKPQSSDEAEDSEDSEDGPSNDGNHYVSLKPFTYDDGKKMLASVQQSLSSHEDSVREIVNNAVNTSHATMVKDLQCKHNALMKENADLRTLYQSEMTAHRTSLDNLARVLQVMARMTEGSSADTQADS